MGGSVSFFTSARFFSVLEQTQNARKKSQNPLHFFVRPKRFQLVVSSPIISDCQREGNKTLEHFHSGGQRPPAASLVSR